MSPGDNRDLLTTDPVHDMPIDVDLFAGPGGWDEGVRHLNIRPVGYEIDGPACGTARAAGHERVQGDLTTVDLERAFANYVLRLLIASPPCQGFSLAGKGQGREDSLLLVKHIPHMTAKNIDAALAWLSDHMKHDGSLLALQPLRWALKLRPQFIALEQVPQVLPLWEACAEVLRAHGYSVATGKLHAEQYGVPQTRTRAILVARRDGKEARLPTPTHSRYYSHAPEKLDEGVQKWVSMAEGLRANEPPWQPIAAIPGDTSWSERRPSPTIVGSFAPDVVAAPGYRKAGDGPRQAQPGSIRVTVREAAVLQSFPADYPWRGSKTAQYQQVGNAVPPYLAYHIVREIMR